MPAQKYDTSCCFHQYVLCRASIRQEGLRIQRQCDAEIRPSSSDITHGAAQRQLGAICRDGRCLLIGAHSWSAAMLWNVLLLLEVIQALHLDGCWVCIAVSCWERLSAHWKLWSAYLCVTKEVCQPPNILLEVPQNEYIIGTGRKLLPCYISQYHRCTVHSAPPSTSSRHRQCGILCFHEGERT